ncbi:hypothetical protein Pelo_19114 [Pelomyxa schiedti]|nr:hypothetical protein Pelo_19114 [Pelomyxa schiedti]
MKQSVLKTLFTGSLVLVLCLAPLSCFADECTSDDYVAAYTECRGDNTRDLLYYKNPASDCEGGVAQPANVFNLPCDITCSSGYYLPYGALTCSPCDPGYFSLGGGTRVMDWVGFPTTGTSSNRLYFNTYAVTSTGTSLSTGKWQLAPNSTLYITSGAIGNSQSSILELSVNLITSGLVGFMYKVDAEPLYDGLEFSIDGTVALAKKWTVLEYTTVAYNLTRGSHTLKWTYSKDMSLSSGSDSASLKVC